MHIFIFLIILFFYNSVHANVVNKKLLCIGDHEEAEVLENYSFNFISINNVEVENSNDEEKIQNYWAEYETTPEYLKVEFGLGILLVIDRKTLILEKHNYNNKFTFNTIGTCKIIDVNKSKLKELLINKMEEQSKKLKEGNKL